MRCRAIQRKLSAFLDGELSEKQTARITRHLSRCTACAQEAASLSSVWEALGESQEIVPSPYFWTHLSARIAQAEEGRFSLGGMWGTLNRLLIPATGIIASVVGLWLGGMLHNLYERPSERREQVASVLHVDALDDFPSESIGLAYMELVSAQEE
jgi:anti-sigma factor RsiW